MAASIWNKRPSTAKLLADKKELLDALKEMKDFGRIKYGNLNQDFNDAWERANAAIAQAEKED